MSDTAMDILLKSICCTLCMGPPRRNKRRAPQPLLNEDYNTSTNTVDLLFDGIAKYRDRIVDEQHDTENQRLSETATGSHIQRLEQSDRMPETGWDSSFAESIESENGHCGYGSVGAHKPNNTNTLNKRNGNKRQVSHNKLRQAAIDDVARQIIMEDPYIHDENQAAWVDRLLPDHQSEFNLFYTAEDVMMSRYNQNRDAGVMKYFTELMSYLSENGLRLLAGGGSRRTLPSTDGDQAPLMAVGGGSMEMDTGIVSGRRGGGRSESLLSESSRYTGHTWDSESTQRMLFSGASGDVEEMADASLVVMQEDSSSSGSLMGSS